MNMETFKKVKDKQISDTSTMKSTYPIPILQYNENKVNY